MTFHEPHYCTWEEYYIQECDHFFRSFRSTADLLTVVSDTIVRAFNRSGATRPQALYISKAFDRVLYAGLLYKLKSCEISGQKFGLFRLENFRFFSVIDGFKWFWMGTLRKNIYKIWEFLKAPFFFVLFPHYKLLTSLMILFVILLSMLMILLSTLSVIRNLIFGND